MVNARVTRQLMISIFRALSRAQSIQRIINLTCAVEMASPKLGDKREQSPSTPSFTIDKRRRSQSPPLPPQETSTNAELSTTSLTSNIANIPSDNAPKLSKPQARPKKGTKGAKKFRRKMTTVEPCSHEDVHWREVVSLLGKDIVDNAINDETDLDAPFEFREELEVEIRRLSSNGEGLALAPNTKGPWVILVPFSLPGEKVRVRIYRNARLHSFADFLGVVQPNTSMRDPGRVRCKYFEKCGGCQYQMLSYDTQLSLKRDVVVRAYETFSNLPGSSVPTILSTAPSPLQYGYRTKITPHFEAPIKVPRRSKGKPVSNGEVPASSGKIMPIGFNKVGTREVLDIEECPIATPLINDALETLRKEIQQKMHTYKKGVSLLLRDSLKIPTDTGPENLSTNQLEEHVIITDHRGKVREKVGDKLFEYNASSFFQNNNAVLVSLVEYVREAIFPATLSSSTPESPALTHLVDAYCGAGLFSIMLSPYFTTIAGIELSTESIASATHNAKLNQLPDGRVTFRAGDAADIFSVVSDFPAEKTAIIIDPPRKGCDENFIDQLLAFRSSTVVYVSCNVHTQARDVGMLLNKSEAEVKEGKKERRYVLESVRGFDLFPQTAHVESVAVLRLVQ